MSGFTYPMTPSQSTNSLENNRYDEKEASAALLSASRSSSTAAESWDDGKLEESASRRQKRHWVITRRRLAWIVLGAIVLVGGYAGTSRKTIEKVGEVAEAGEAEIVGITVNATTEELLVEGFDTSLVLNFPTPQDRFSSQLKPGVRYITSIGFGGHSNQFIGVVKLFYLGQLTNRVAIAPTLTPLHFNGGPEKFSQFYDLDRFFVATSIPVVDFSAFKSVGLSGVKDDRISCWSVQEVTPTGGANRAADSMAVHSVGVDFWALPKDMARGLGGNDLAYDSIRLFDFNVWARRMWIETVSSIFLRSRRRELTRGAQVKKQFLPQTVAPIATNLRKARPVFKVDLSKTIKGGFSPLTTPPPSDQLMCLDNSLFLGPVMFEPAFTPTIPEEPTGGGEGLSWIAVGQHLRFATEVEDVVDEYLLNLFSVERLVDVPPFITIHLRRTDFISFTVSLVVSPSTASHLTRRVAGTDTAGKVHARARSRNLENATSTR